ncbi:MAG: prepilin-type N-terminal cleavage/methylation domain-containing protein [Verrucomicrobia bacterium]|nr:prepilin-type N-terminal cleavage/methylation domain-containing protein [Verrucomicrobiota bacterium]
MTRICPAPSCRPDESAGGFTLVESLVSLLILALILTATTWTATLLLMQQKQLHERSRAWLELESLVAHDFAGLPREEMSGRAYPIETALIEPPGETNRAWTRITVRDREDGISLATLHLLVLPPITTP